MSDYFTYEDEDGDPVRRVKKWYKDGRKQFSQEHWNGGSWVRGVKGTEDVPYHLPLILDCIERGEEAIWIVEGEKDADNMREAFGVVATTNAGGAGKWRDYHSRFLRGAEKVNIVYDKDPEGRAHAWTVFDSLRRFGIPDIRFLQAKEGKDATDHINGGWGIGDFVRAKPKRLPPQQKEERKSEDVSDNLPAAFQLALVKLRDLGVVSLEDPIEQQYNTVCPAHDDKNPSLSIRPGQVGRDSVSVMVTCHAGCTAQDIANALGIDQREFTEFSQEEQTKIDLLTQTEYERQMARRAAQIRILEEQTSGKIVKLAGNPETGKDELKQPLEPEKWLVKDWFTYGSVTTLIADAKAGKTALSIGLMNSICNDEPFLGKYEVTFPESARVLYFNFDMTVNQFRTYLHDIDTWKNPDRFIVKHLGAGEFPFWRDDVRADFVQFCLEMNVQLWVVDTLQMFGQGFITDENNNTEIAALYGLVKSIVREAGVPHTLITHHRGRAKDERARGASALDGATDAWWMLTMEDREIFDSPRKLGARGRGIGQSPIALDFDVATGLYSTTGMRATRKPVGDSRVGKYAELCRKVKAYFDEKKSWPRGNVVRSMLTGENAVRNSVIEEAVELELIRKVVVAGRSYEVVLTSAGLAAVNADGKWTV